jgi:transposase-like protein
MKWKDLGGEERYRVVEMVRNGEASLKEICVTFGVSRQTVHHAMEKADRASIHALEPKPPGKKPKTPQAVEMEKLTTTNADLTKELDHLKQKYEVAKTFLDLTRKLERGEKLPSEEGRSGKKTKTRSKRKREKR